MKKFDIRILFSKNFRDFLFAGPVGSQVAKKSPCIFRLQMCVVVFMTTATCPYPEPPQFPFLKYFNIILPTTTVSSKLSLSLWFSNQNPVCISLLPHKPRVLCTSHSSWYHHPNHWSLQTKKPNIIQLTPTHSKRATTVIGHSLWTAGEILSYCLLKKGPSVYLLPSYTIHCALILLYGQSRRLRKIPSPQ